MLFLKSLLFIIWNVLLGASLIWTLRCLLFNRKARFFFGAHIPLTPGFIVNKRDWIFNKARAILHDYLEQAEDSKRKNGYLVKWEQKVYDAIWAKTAAFGEWKYLPHKVKVKIRTLIANTGKDIAAKVLRFLVPRIVAQLRLEYHIDRFDEQFSNEVLLGYYNRYVHKYLLYFFVAINIVIGIMNMILFLIIAPGHCCH